MLALVGQRTNPVPFDPVDLGRKPQTLVFARRDAYGETAFDTRMISPRRMPSSSR